MALFKCWNLPKKGYYDPKPWQKIYRELYKLLLSIWYKHTQKASELVSHRTVFFTMSEALYELELLYCSRVLEYQALSPTRHPSTFERPSLHYVLDSVVK